MIGIVAKLKIKEGSGSDFEAIATQLVEKVNANDYEDVPISLSHNWYDKFLQKSCDMA